MISLRVIFPVILSTSAKTAFAPVYSIAWAVAVCVCAGTITSSPFLKPEARQEICKPAVQLETESAYFDFVNFSQDLLPRRTEDLLNLGSATKKTRTAMGNLAISNIDEFFKTGNCKNKVN